MSDRETGYVDAPGARLYYEAEGKGTPILMIHAGVAHLRMWDEQVEAWGERHRIIRYDTRGWGRTLVEDVPFSNIADVAAVMDHQGVQAAHLVGLSRGGQIALDFTISNPGRVRSLTWVASGIGGFELDDPRLVDVWPEMERVEEARDWERLVELETQLWTDGPGQAASRVDPSVRSRMVQWNMENYIAEQPANQPIRPEFEAAELLASIKVPVLAVWGTFDEAAVPAAGAKMAAEVPGARSHVFEGVAHMVNLERPEEFNRLVGEFIDEVDAGVGSD